MKTRCCISLVTLIFLAVMSFGQAHGRTSTDLTLSELPAGGTDDLERVWTVSEVPEVKGPILEAGLNVELSASSPAVLILMARSGGVERTFSSMLVHPGQTSVTLDATGLVRAQADGMTGEVFLVRKAVEPPAGVRPTDSHSPVQPDRMNGATLSTIAAPERRSRVRDIIRDRDTEPDIALAPDSPGLPIEFGAKAYPNPFNPVTTIQVALPKADVVDVTVYNVRGQRVKTLHSGNMKPGYNNLKWRGLDGRGNPVASGVYFYRVKAGLNVHTGKLMLLK